jgi:hypothetical protein
MGRSHRNLGAGPQTVSRQQRTIWYFRQWWTSSGFPGGGGDCWSSILHLWGCSRDWQKSVGDNMPEDVVRWTPQWVVGLLGALGFGRGPGRSEVSPEPGVLSRMIQSARFRFRPARYRQQAAGGGRAPEACSGRTGGRTTEAYSTGAGGGSRQASAGGVHPDSIAVSVSMEPGPAVSEHPGPMATVPNLGMSRFLVFQSLQI